MSVANPFCPPMLAGNPHQPLRPWDDGCDVHDMFYVPVDNTALAYELFREQSGGLETVISVGRLVVVTGGQGCGKTSLVNRCVWYAREHLKDELKTRLVIADITGECTDNQSVSERVGRVATMIIDQLEDVPRGPIAENDLADLRARLSQDGPSRMYRRLSQLLKRLPEADSMALAVLLPPSADLEQEVLQYADYVEPRLLFFAESSFLEANGGWRSKLSSSSRAVPLVLTVGPLKREDFWDFAKNRLGLHNSVDVPHVDQGVMDVVYQPESQLSVGHLQKLMFGVYEELLRSPDLPGRVTLEDISRYVFRTWRPW